VYAFINQQGLVYRTVTTHNFNEQHFLAELSIDLGLEWTTENDADFNPVYRSYIGLTRAVCETRHSGLLGTSPELIDRIASDRTTHPSASSRKLSASGLLTRQRERAADAARLGSFAMLPRRAVTFEHKVPAETLATPETSVLQVLSAHDAVLQAALASRNWPREGSGRAVKFGFTNESGHLYRIIRTYGYDGLVNILLIGKQLKLRYERTADTGPRYEGCLAVLHPASTPDRQTGSTDETPFAESVAIMLA
jgi:hypothetical protein